MKNKCHKSIDIGHNTHISQGSRINKMNSLLTFLWMVQLFEAFWYHLVIHAQTDCWISTHHQVYPKDFHVELSNSIYDVACWIIKFNPGVISRFGMTYDLWNKLIQNPSTLVSIFTHFSLMWLVQHVLCYKGYFNLSGEH